MKTSLVLFSLVIATMLSKKTNSQPFVNINAGIKQVTFSQSGWADYDNDGDLDLIQTGYTPSGAIKSIIYRNDNPMQNSVPTQPLNLSSVVDDADVTLSWESASDNETPSAGLTYNAYVRDEYGAIVWSSSSLETGFRMLPAIGNTTQDLSWKITGLADAHYFWSVQAVDNCFAGSAFADEEMFTIGTTTVDDITLAEGVLYPNPSTGRFIIDMTDISGVQSVSVFNENGREVLFVKHPEQLLNVDIEMFGKGVYIVRVTAGRDTYSGSLLVK